MFLLQRYDPDPCYLPNETIENWARKLRELAPIAVAGLEKVIKENELEEITNIIRPKFECLKQLDENTNEPCFDWQQVQLLDTTEVMDTIQYELGKWFFFNEQYGNASGYFAKVSNKYESQFPHLADYKNSSMKLSSTKYDSSRNQVLLHNQFLECLDRLEQGEASDLYEVQSNLDPQIVEQELRERLQTNTDNEQQATRLKQIICYLACKDIRFRPLWHEVNVNCIRKSTNRSRKYGNGITNRGSETSKQTIEKKLLESIEPAHILELSTQVTRRALLINRKWELPRHHYNLLKNSILKKDQRIAIHIVLAKAFELRRARLYSAARTLFLSLLEDVQINFPKLAEVISYELLQTDLEIVARNPLTVKDKDPRRTADLSAKCEIAISKEQIINNISPNLLCYAGLFLLERDNPVIMDYLHSANPILKLAACLHTLGHSSRSSGATELWDLLVGSLSTSGSGNSVTGGSMHMNKRRGQIQFPTVIMSADQLILVLQNIRSIKYICLLISAFGRIHNLVRDNQQLELTLPAAVNWPNSIGPNGMSIELSRVSGLLKILLQSALQQQPNELHWLKVKAELALMETNYDQALHSLLHMLIVKSAYFTHFEATPDEEYLIQKMITCSMKLFCYTQAVILHQMCREINYSLVFKALAEKHCFDSCDDLYECIWDVTILEYLIHLHHRRGEVDRKTKIVRLIGQLELNANNAEHIRQQAAHVRRGRFFRYMAKKYL